MSNNDNEYCTSGLITIDLRRWSTVDLYMQLNTFFNRSMVLNLNTILKL